MKDLAIRFIEPLDVLILRGNRLFGDPGSYGESRMPPWPSVFAGALRSRILADDGVDLEAFARSTVVHPELGTPEEPGSFRLVALYLAKRQGDTVEICVPLPADLSVAETTTGDRVLRRLRPQTLAAGLDHSGILPMAPVLVEATRVKPATGYWLKESGWQRYLAGELPHEEDLEAVSQLWQMDERIGVGLSAEQRAAESGKLFTTQAIALKAGVGFVVAVDGASVPDAGLLRLGGDGRGAAVQALTRMLPEPDYAAIAAAGRCRVVLTSPAIFMGGWIPNGVDPDADFQLTLPGIRGRLVSAVNARGEIVSGWDLARWQPKLAQRVVPTGSVYWLDELEASAEVLAKFARGGWWSDSCEDDARAAEGFNRLTLATW